MIRIVKPAAPSVLITKGQVAAQGHCDSYDTHADYRQGTISFVFFDTIYAHDDVKAALRTAQQDKCAFCESKVSHIAYGDIEHFRPKGGYRQRESDELEQPGYYWLAYDWTNLFFSCQLCNQRFKKNLFPLRNPNHRARSHRDDVSREKPLLLDPARDSPKKHLTYTDEMVRALDQRGTVTIEVLGLNRPELVEQRLERLRMLKLVKDCRRSIEQKPRPHSTQDRETIAKCNRALKDAILAEAEYAAMARTFLS